MSDLYAFFDLLLDLVFLLPPFDVIESWQLSELAAKTMCFGAVFLFFLSWLWRDLSDFSLFDGHPILSKVVLVAVLLLAFGSVPKDVWSAIFSTGYVAMILGLRLVEGAALGAVIVKRPRMLTIVFLVIAVIVAGVGVRLRWSNDELALLKAGWSTLAAVIASVSITKSLSVEFDSPLSGIALFFVFLSTILYVGGSKTLQVAYVMAYVLGVMVAPAASWYERQKREKADELRRDVENLIREGRQSQRKRPKR